MLDQIPAVTLLAVYALAVARVTGLVVSDSITEPVRDRIVGWLDDRPGSAGAFLAELIQCPWCAGMWVSMAAVPVIGFAGENPVVIGAGLALAFSQVTGMIAGVGR